MPTLSIDFHSPSAVRPRLRAFPVLGIQNLMSREAWLNDGLSASVLRDGVQSCLSIYVVLQKCADSGILAIRLQRRKGMDDHSFKFVDG